MERRFRVAFWGLLAWTAFTLLVWAGSLPLTDPDESRFARTSIEMMRAGDPVLPTFEGAPRLVKPPLLHWIQCALFALFGVSTWAARLPAALATLGFVALAAWAVRGRFGAEGAFWAAAVVATSPLVVLLGRIGNLDALLAVHVFAAVAVDMLSTPGVGRRARGATIGALLGLGFLVKGPVGVALPLLIMLAGRTATRRELLPRLGPLLAGTAAWAVVVLPWGLALLGRVGAATALSTLREESLRRYFSGTSHVEPFWYYLPLLAVAMLPWTGALLTGLVRLVRMRRDPAARTGLYAGAGLLAGVLFLSAGQGKLPSYLLPLIPLAALVVAWEIGQQLRQPTRRLAGPALTAGTLGLTAIALALASMAGLTAPQRVAALVGAAIHGAAALVAMPALALLRPRWVYGAATAAAATFLLTAILLLAPSLVGMRSSAGLIEEVAELRSGRPVIVVDMKVPSLTYYLDRVPEQLSSRDLAARLDQADRPVVVFDEVDLPRVPPPALSRLREIGRAGKYRAYEEPREPSPSLDGTTDGAVAF